MLDNWEKLSNILQNVFTMSALVLGGIISYFKFVKGRIFSPRLEPAIKGRFREVDGCRFLIISAELKNVGASKVSIDSSSGFDISFDECASIPEGDRLPIEEVVWRPPVSYRVFESHEWIESGETIREERVFSIKSDVIAARVDLQLATGRTTATAIAVIMYGDDNYNPTEEEDENARSERHRKAPGGKGRPDHVANDREGAATARA